MTQQDSPGAIALVGSGEYLDAMNKTDSYLLDMLGGPAKARVALLPTASGLEPDGPTSWNNLGLQHFKALGVADVQATAIIDHTSANDPHQLALLREANFYYFSGGNPQHLIESLRDSQAWEIIFQAHKRGAVLAGCSAGAMALGGYTLALREMLKGKQPGWKTALGVLPQLVVFPHFDRMANFIDDATFHKLLSSLPAGITALGIDENTALVHSQNDASAGKSSWHVMGQLTVKMFIQDGSSTILHSGDSTML